MSRVNLQYSNVSKGRHGKVFQFLDLCACLPISSPSHLSVKGGRRCYAKPDEKSFLITRDIKMFSRDV